MLMMAALAAPETKPTAKKALGPQRANKKGGTAQSAAKAAQKTSWKLSYTPDGQPDLQGIWTNLSFTPMVRPAEYGNREFLTKEEMDWDFKSGVARSYDTTLGNAADSPSTMPRHMRWTHGKMEFSRIPEPLSLLIRRMASFLR
jgi:hypothetical protein